MKWTKVEWRAAVVAAVALAVVGLGVAVGQLASPRAWSAAEVRVLAAGYVALGVFGWFLAVAVQGVVASHRQMRQERRSWPQRERRLQEAVAALERASSADGSSGDGTA